MTEIETLSINDIQERMARAGSHWWDHDTMQFFRCKVDSELYYSPDDKYFFVTRDRTYDDGAAYSVRCYCPQSNEISTIGDFGAHSTLNKARRAIRLLGAVSLVARGIQHEPFTAAESFSRALALHNGVEISGQTVARLIAKSKLHQSLMEQYCNGREVYGVDGEPKQPLRLCRKAIVTLAVDLGCPGVTFSGDPRGCTVKLQLQDGAHNDMGHDGWCVPME